MKSIKELRNEINESKQEDIADLKALLKNPDPKVAKNYGGIEGYKKMIQSKIDKLMKEETELEEGSMDKMSLQDLWMKFADSDFQVDQLVRDQGYGGIGQGSPRLHGKIQRAIFKHVSDKYGKRTAIDMANYGATNTYNDEYAGPEEKDANEKYLKKLAKKHGIKESTELDEPKVIELARDVLENGAKKVKDPVTGKSHLLDAFSASAIVQIYEKLGAANQKKMVSMPLPKIVSVVFKLVNKSKNESVEELDEALTRAQRIKRSQIAKRNKAKIQRALKKGKKKKASTETLQKRAKKKARDLLYTKLLKGRNRADVSAGEQERIEKKLDKMQGGINRIAKKLLPQLKKAEQEKLKKKSEE